MRMLRAETACYAVEHIKKLFWSLYKDTLGVAPETTYYVVECSKS